MNGKELLEKKIFLVDLPIDLMSECAGVCKDVYQAYKRADDNLAREFDGMPRHTVLKKMGADAFQRYEAMEKEIKADQEAITREALNRLNTLDARLKDYISASFTSSGDQLEAYPDKYLFEHDLITDQEEFEGIVNRITDVNITLVHLIESYSRKHHFSYGNIQTNKKGLTEMLEAFMSHCMMGVRNPYGFNYFRIETYTTNEDSFKDWLDSFNLRANYMAQNEKLSFRR